MKVLNNFTTLNHYRKKVQEQLQGRDKTQKYFRRVLNVFPPEKSNFKLMKRKKV